MSINFKAISLRRQWKNFHKSMQFSHKNDGVLEFKIEEWMRVGLERALQCFPIQEVPESFLSKTMSREEILEDETILKESLKEMRDQNKEFAEVFLQRKPFRQIEGRWSLTIKEKDVEPLLKITNNVRIGCWVRLGFPEETALPPKEQHFREDFYLMHICGIFQSALIEAL